MIRTLLLFIIGVAMSLAADRQIFLLIGQSNMAGRGIVEDQDRQPIPHVFSLNKQMEWVPAIDPLHFDKPDIAGVGLGRGFAKTLLTVEPQAEIGLVPAAFGGTSLDEWKPGGKLYVDAVKRAKFAMQSGKLRGILWHQGEGDSIKEEDARSYGHRFDAMITQLRADLNAPEVPVVVGELGRFLKERPDNKSVFAAIVGEQLAMIPLHVARTVFVPSAALTSNPDHVHFDAKSQRELGRRYALAFLSLDSTW